MTDTDAIKFTLPTIRDLMNKNLTHLSECIDRAKRVLEAKLKAQIDETD